jgi:hypothetical protein
MDNFFIFLLITFLLTPLIAYWAYRKNQSPIEFAFLSLIFTPILPALILLVAVVQEKSKSGSNGNLAN